MLLEIFPDACIVFTHRDPAECIGSYCSMIEVLMAVRRDVDPREIGPVVLEYLARSLERGLAARDRSDPRRFFDVDYRRFVEDPLGVARALYDHFGLPRPPGTDEALARHVRENPRGKHGAHEYGLEAYGLTPERVRERLASYLDRFAIPIG